MAETAAAVVLNQVKGGKGAYGDMIDAGILDPAKVTRLALQNATSVSGLLLTTEVMIAERLVTSRRSTFSQLDPCRETDEGSSFAVLWVTSHARVPTAPIQ